MGKTKFSEEVHVHGHAPKPRRDRPAKPRGTGLWFVILRDLEHDGVHYLPLNHHLVTSGNIPERVPSCGAKSTRAGDNSVPVDATGMINLEGVPPGQIFALCQNRTVAPVNMTKQIEQLLLDGSRANALIVPQMIPPMQRVTNLSQHISQVTGENLPKPKFGGTNQAMFENLMKKFPAGLAGLPVTA